MPEAKQRPPHPAKYLGAGLTWAGSTGLFTYVGWLLDARWQTKPVFTLIGAFVGGAAGFYHLYRRLISGTRPPVDKHESNHKE